MTYITGLEDSLQKVNRTIEDINNDYKEGLLTDQGKEFSIKYVSRLKNALESSINDYTDLLKRIRDKS